MCLSAAFGLLHLHRCHHSHRFRNPPSLHSVPPWCHPFSAPPPAPFPEEPPQVCTSPIQKCGNHWSRCDSHQKRSHRCCRTMLSWSHVDQHRLSSFPPCSLSSSSSSSWEAMGRRSVGAWIDHSSQSRCRRRDENGSASPSPQCGKVAGCCRCTIDCCVC